MFVLIDFFFFYFGSPYRLIVIKNTNNFLSFETPYRLQYRKKIHLCCMCIEGFTHQPQQSNDLVMQCNDLKIFSVNIKWLQLLWLNYSIISNKPVFMSVYNWILYFCKVWHPSNAFLVFLRYFMFSHHSHMYCM